MGTWGTIEETVVRHLREPDEREDGAIEALERAVERTTEVLSRLIDHLFDVDAMTLEDVSKILGTKVVERGDDVDE